MDINAANELSYIRSELNSIIAELESISYGVKKDFVGIGNDKCGAAIDRVIRQYYNVRNSLNNLDTTTVTESYAQAHGMTNNGGGA